MQQTNRVTTLMTTEKHFAQTLQRLPRFLAIHSPNLNESFFGTASLFLGTRSRDQRFPIQTGVGLVWRPEAQKKSDTQSGEKCVTVCREGEHCSSRHKSLEAVQSRPEIISAVHHL